MAGARPGVRARVCAPQDRRVSKWGGIRAPFMAIYGREEGSCADVRACVCAASLFPEAFPERLLRNTGPSRLAWLQALS